MKKHLVAFSAAVCAVLLISGCAENYSNGERIGFVTQFSSSGLIWKSWEGHLNLTQTGMNSSVPFDFSIDNDKEDDAVIKTIDSAALHGWKVKLVYHETRGWNWFNNRGETDHFITHAEVLDRNPMGFLHGNSEAAATAGKTVDTIYVVIVGRASDNGRK
jgi:hypothetical protein